MAIVRDKSGNGGGVDTPIDPSNGGPSDERPIDPPKFFMYFDTTLNKPIWYLDPGWVDATGTSVE